MSQLGQQRRIAHVQVMSASPQIPVELMTVGDGKLAFRQFTGIKSPTVDAVGGGA